MISVFSRKSGSSLALAIALATGGTLIATAVLPEDASAQRAPRDRDRERSRDNNTQQEDGGGYSDAFREAYVPLDETIRAGGADFAALRPQLDALAAILNTNDEKIAGGGLLFNAGIASQDQTLQLRGMEIMLSSGKVPADQVGRYNFIAYQISNGQGDYAKARTYLQGAIDNNFTTDTISAPDLQIAMAESFFASDELQAGFDFLRGAIAGRRDQGLSVDEQWYRRGVTVAYENETTPEVYEFATLWLAEYPSQDNWRDAVNVARNLNEFEGPEILDLFRLARKVGAMQDPSDYDYYVEAADARRLPKEVRDVIQEGMAAGDVAQDNLFISEALEIASGRIEADRADLPALETDASAADATLRTVVAAGDTFLSYEMFDKAAPFYERALSMEGVATDVILTRLGMAQVGLGDFDAARASLGRVSGVRVPIAMLWAAYANELEANAAPAPAPATM